MSYLLTEKEKSRLLEKIDIGNPDECWEWKGMKDAYGYGKVIIKRLRPSSIRVTRVLMADLGYLKGIYNLLDVLHHCDNPSCVNPHHLYVGTQTDNVSDMMTRGRSKFFNRLNKEAVKVIKWHTKYNHYPGLQEKLARLYKVSRRTINRISNGESYPEIRV